MFILRWFGDSFQFRMLWGYIGTNFPCTVYYYGPTILWDNVVPLIMWICIVDVCNFITNQLCLGSLRSPSHEGTINTARVP